MNVKLLFSLLFLLSSLSAWTQDEEKAATKTYKVKVTNLTKGQGFGLPIVVSHSHSLKIFEVGGMASEGLRILAEDGNNTPLAMKLKQNSRVLDVVAPMMPILPGKSRVFEIKTSAAKPYISVLGMLGTTNDSFGAVQMIKRANYSHHYGDAYDAGTEVNNELCAFIPGPPCGNPGVRQPEGSEGFIYVGNGVQGIGDLDRTLFDWNNAVIKVEVMK